MNAHPLDLIFAVVLAVLAARGFIQVRNDPNIAPKHRIVFVGFGVVLAILAAISVVRAFV